MRRILSALALLGTLGACGSGGPYVYLDPAVALTKSADLIRRNGTFSVCFDDGEADKADALAAETCAEYKLTALKARIQRYQCSLTEPHLGTYYCVDPTMRLANGRYINPLDKSQVKSWQEQQIRLRAAAARHGAAAAGSAPAPAEPGAAAQEAPPAPDLAH